MNRVIASAWHADTPLDFAPHTHETYEIIFLTKGRVCVGIAGKVYDAVSPSLIFISKHEQHSLTVTGEDYERYCISILPAFAENAVRDYRLLSLLSHRPEGFCHVLPLGNESEAVERIFRGIVSEHEEKLAYADTMMAAYLSELLVLVYRASPCLFTPESAKSISAIWRIQVRFEERPEEHYTLTSLAAEYHRSPSGLSHLFKRVTGYSVMEYLTMCRLSLARRLLLETELSVTDIVYRTGFSDSSNFSRLFKREMNMSPVAYRRRMREGK